MLPLLMEILVLQHGSSSNTQRPLQLDDMHAWGGFKVSTMGIPYLMVNNGDAIVIIVRVKGGGGEEAVRGTNDAPAFTAWPQYNCLSDQFPMTTTWDGRLASLRVSPCPEGIRNPNKASTDHEKTTLKTIVKLDEHEDFIHIDLLTSPLRWVSTAASNFDRLKSYPAIPMKSPYDRVKQCRERKINIKASENVNVDVFRQNKRPCLQHSKTQFFSCYYLSLDEYPGRTSSAQMANSCGGGIAFISRQLGIQTPKQSQKRKHHGKSKYEKLTSILVDVVLASMRSPSTILSMIIKCIDRAYQVCSHIGVNTIEKKMTLSEYNPPDETGPTYRYSEPEKTDNE
ncbi:hypothetical protein PR048_022010 [Dryococelus australis]|uniref:Uncharacterized protein n=1 Tax=Dryococelus australis TaxID=614101 RepID=A0ABQ9GZW3_9NEOP|nr:hypothetical protein PR048_022010 [Dryococelus australis]